MEGKIRTLFLDLKYNISQGKFKKKWIDLVIIIGCYDFWWWIKLGYIVK